MVGHVAKAGSKDTPLRDLLGELLLDHSGLSPTECLMVMTPTFNNLDFDVVAEALIKQLARQVTSWPMKIGMDHGKNLKGTHRTVKHGWEPWHYDDGYQDYSSYGMGETWDEPVR